MRFSSNHHTPLFTDKYEYTMLQSAIEAGIQDKKAVFELYARRLPENRLYGVVAGTQRVLEALNKFVFSEEDLDYLSEFLDEKTINYLEKFSFKGNVSGYKEGDVFFPNSPILTVEATFGEGILLETLLLSIMNYDSAVASAASHLVRVAKGKKLSELGSRRTNEQAAVFASRAAYLAGFDATSNLEAGRRFPEIPVYGTSAHAFTLAFESEKEAFEAQIKSFGKSTTLLVDTYDTYEGIRTAVEVAGTELSAIRIDSGNPAEVIPEARELLNSLGATKTKIVFSGDLDYLTVEKIMNENLPVDSFGIGTEVVTGGGSPACGFVYKLVSIEDANAGMRSVAKKSANKSSFGGRKNVYREYDDSWKILKEHVSVEPLPNMTSVQIALMIKGALIEYSSLKESREYHKDVIESISGKPVEVVLHNLEKASNTVEADNLDAEEASLELDDEILEGSE